MEDATVQEAQQLILDIPTAEYEALVMVAAKNKVSIPDMLLSTLRKILQQEIAKSLRSIEDKPTPEEILQSKIKQQVAALQAAMQSSQQAQSQLANQYAQSGMYNQGLVGQASQSSLDDLFKNSSLFGKLFGK